MKSIISLLICVICLTLFSSTSFADLNQEQGFEKPLDTNNNKSTLETDNNLRIILLDNPVTQTDTDHFTRNNIKVVKTFHIIPAIVVEIPSEAEGGIEKLNLVSSKNNKFVKSFPNLIGHVALDTSVPQINGDAPYNIGLRGDGIKVCTVDTGVNPHDNLPTLANQIDFVNDDFIANDDNAHGTHVAGIIASNHATYRGVAPNVSLLAAKSCDAAGGCTSVRTIEGIEWCVDKGADVINISVEIPPTSSCDQPHAIAANTANNQGVVVVAASGNSKSTQISSPACASGVIGVGAVTDSDTLWADGNLGSNTGPKLDIVAPGANIVSLHFSGGTNLGQASGTSQAVPHVAGAAALVLQKFPSYTPLQVKNALYDNAVDLGTAGFDNTFGNGRLDVSFLDDLCDPPESGDWIITSSCTMSFNTNLFVSDTWTVNPGVTLTMISGSRVTFSSGGTINNLGTIDISGGRITASGGTINNSGAITVNSEGQLRAMSGSITNNSGGTITINSGGSSTNNGSITNNSGGIITINSGGAIFSNSVNVVYNYGTIINTGTFTLLGGILENRSGGTFTNNSGGTIANNNNGDTIGLIKNLLGSTLTNSGTITNSGNIVSCGTYTGALPSSGNQIIFCTTTGNTTITLDATIPLESDFTVNSGALVTINSGVTLTIDRNLIVKSGGGVLIKSGGTLQVSFAP